MHQNYPNSKSSHQPSKMMQQSKLSVISVELKDIKVHSGLLKKCNISKKSTNLFKDQHVTDVGELATNPHSAKPKNREGGSLSKRQANQARHSPLTLTCFKLLHHDKVLD